MSGGFQTLDQLIKVAANSGDRGGMQCVARHEYGNSSYPSPWDKKGSVNVLRFEHLTERRENGKPRKSITQAHLADDGLWHLGLPNPDPAKSRQGRPLYRLDEAVAARERGDSVLLLEGERAVDAAWACGIPATCCLGGSNALSLTDLEPLCSGVVPISGSEDVAGRKYEHEAAAQLHQQGADARIVRFPGLRTDCGDDLVEFIANRITDGRSGEEIRAEVIRLVEAAKSWTPPNNETTRGTKKSLAELAMEKCVLFHDRELEGYARIPVNGHVETHAIQTSRPFRLWLGRVAYEADVSGSTHAIDETIGHLAAQAAYDPASQEIEVHRRWSWFDGTLYYDLVDPDWRIVEARADAGGGATLRVLSASECPVQFIRSPGAMPQPAPVDGGALDELRPLLNITDESWTILRGFLLSVLVPAGERHHLEIDGEPNTGKSFLTGVVLDLTDPSRAGEVGMPKAVDDLYVRAKHRRVLAIGNVSSLSLELSDALCRICTGTGTEDRTLYTNSGISDFTAHSSIVTNGIGRYVTQPDLESRTLHVETIELSDEQQREREELLGKWATIRPRVFGALVRAAAVAYARREQVVLKRKPRLADAARFVEAGAQALGLAPGEWTDSVLGQRECSSRELVEDSLAVRTLRDFAIAWSSERGEPWIGSAEKLLAALNARVPAAERDDPRLGWPRKPRGLGGLLKRYARPLRAVGVFVEKLPWIDHGEPQRVTVHFIAQAAEQRSERSDHSVPREDSGALRSVGLADGALAGVGGTSRSVAVAIGRPPGCPGDSGAFGAFGASVPELTGKQVPGFVPIIGLDAEVTP